MPWAEVGKEKISFVICSIILLRSYSLAKSDFMLLPNACNSCFGVSKNFSNPDLISLISSGFTGVGPGDRTVAHLSCHVKFSVY